jgi:hypothetical protein
MSPAEASVLIQSLRSGQFAVFQLPDPRAFAQALRTSTGDLHIEVTLADPALETLMQGVGPVSRNDLGFLTVEMRPDDDSRSGEVVARALAMLAKTAGCENVCRATSGAQ